jgi:DNA-binding response OmpR family regulator
MKGDAEDPPIIAISPSAMRDIQRRCLEAGMQERIRKPVRLREISATLQRWLPPDVARGLRSPSRMRDSNAANRATDSDSGDAVSRRLEELFSTLHDRAFLGKQLRHLAQTTRRRWEAIDDAFQSGDLSAVRQHTASLRDLLEPLRAKDVLESCAQIKAAAEGGDLQALSHLAEDLKRQTGELIDLLERHCRRTATRRKAPPPTAAV